MKTTEQMEPGGSTHSRRTFLKTAGAGLSFAVVFGSWGVKTFSAQGSRRVRESAFGAWVKIGADGSILIYNPAAEMGQGSMTALPVIIAEELDADWSKVRIEHSPIEPDIYGLSWRRGWPRHHDDGREPLRDRVLLQTPHGRRPDTTGLARQCGS